jgi:hypothetical protein
MPLNHRFFGALVLLFAMTIRIEAQVTTGTPPFGSFGGGPDVINLVDLNAHLTIPILNKPGRGTNFIYDLTNDSTVWFPVGSSGSQSWSPTALWGWAGQTQAATGFIVYTLRTYQCLLDPGPPRQYGTRYDYNNWVYVDKFGTGHGFGLFGVEDNDCGQTTSGTATATALAM